MKKAAIASLALVMFATPVLAEEGGPRGHRGPGPDHFIKELDTDGDGKISRAEFAAKGDKMFAEADANKDGFLTKDEMKAAHEARKAKWKEKRGEFKGKKAE